MWWDNLFLLFKEIERNILHGSENNCLFEETIYRDCLQLWGKETVYWDFFISWYWQPAALTSSGSSEKRHARYSRVVIKNFYCFHVKTPCKVQKGCYQELLLFSCKNAMQGIQKGCYQEFLLFSCKNAMQGTVGLSSRIFIVFM